MNLEQRKNLLSNITLEEKIKLLSGHRFFQTKGIKRLGIRPLKMTDGPLGVSMHSSFFRKNTKFPGGINLASTWNKNLSYRFGQVIAKEARAVGRFCLLAPGINIIRTPLNGRNFEYFSEDPFLTKEIAVHFIKGVQNQKVASCLKHYVCNNQETNRFTISAEIEDRALHELYLRAFKDVIQEADPWTLMTSYNQVNSKYIHENKEILLANLEKWGFSGIVMTDWWATSKGKRRPKDLSELPPKTMLSAGVTLEMPTSYVYSKNAILNSMEKGLISENELDNHILSLLQLFNRVGMFSNKNNLPKGERNIKSHQELARKISEEGIVLLKNENNFLPLRKGYIDKITISGPNADKKFGRLLYGGSSAVKPPYEITIKKGLQEYCKKIKSIKIVKDPAKADVQILVMGLNHDSDVSFVRGITDTELNTIKHGFDTEGTDRSQYKLPKEQIEYIKKRVANNPNTVVILNNGSPVGMNDWINDVPAIIEAWYPGMEGGRAIANILFGKVNPSGKLPVTFPKQIDDSPAHVSTLTFPGENNLVKYAEGIYVGYRYFEKNNIEPLFPFGYGLSYSDFQYKSMSLSKKSVAGGIKGSFIVTAELKNSSNIAGSEIVQVYSHCEKPSIDRPYKELIGFEKVFIMPGESKIVNIPIKIKDMAFYDTKLKKWKIDRGSYSIFINSSSSKSELSMVILLN